MSVNKGIAIAMAACLGGWTGYAAAAVDMAAVLEAEYAGIEAAMCPSAGGTAAGGGGAMDDYELHRVEPFKVFVNLYYVGMDNISAWALTTSTWPGDPHPFVTGHAGVERWAELLRKCTREVLSDKRAAGL